VLGRQATHFVYPARVRVSDFDYELPQELIAQHAVERGASRMLFLDRSSGAVRHLQIADVVGLLAADDLLLLNDTRVIPARLYARRSTGRRFELLLLSRAVDATWEALLRPAARARRDEELMLADGGTCRPCERLEEGRWLVRFEPPLDLPRLDRLGEAPLPPYIERPAGATAEDRTRYQTVYAREPGAVAAPTAGLHFDDALLERIRARGVEVAFVTLHVGLGTFRPVQVEEVEDHLMHHEWYRFSAAAAAAVNRALEGGRRVVCVGTTSVRALEAALVAGGGKVTPGEAWTDLFITPGFEFRGCGALLTNFHLPRSTLLMMVSAFASRERVLAAYQEAIREGYRFYSYGDAMLIV
jgi:S-adenosylmethionine:tRNA ribosyltransferase-isomerase